ncbi:MAG: energy transducer TonB [Chitinophagaceae bacterium]
MNHFFVFQQKQRIPSIMWLTLLCVACCMSLTTSAFALPVKNLLDTLPGDLTTKTNRPPASSPDFDTQSSYPGGAPAWSMHLMKNLRYPSDAWNKKISGQVMVSFTVNEKGRLRDLKAISGADELKAEAIRVIASSGRWTPAMLNGKPVTSQRQQAIKFVLE